MKMTVMAALLLASSGVAGFANDLPPGEASADPALATVPARADDGVTGSVTGDVVVKKSRSDCMKRHSAQLQMM